MTHPETADLVLLHARQALTCAGRAPKRGAHQGDVSAIDDAAVAAFEGRIAYVGPSNAIDEHVTAVPDAVVWDLRHEHTIVPGLVDAHTHAAFAGDRRAELKRRLAGESYAQIAASGGGILSTVTATRAASESGIVASTRPRLDEMLACGTTTCEIKSGYGLTTEAELKLLRAIATLARTHPLSIVPTFLGAHEVPVEYCASRDQYVDLVVAEMIPAVAACRLAEWCDVFCEEGVFTPEQSRRVLEAGSKAGLKPRIHADELRSSGGSQVASAVGARSADHLVFVSEGDMRQLAVSGVTATLLPIAAFYLKLARFAPARTLIAADVPVALGTDLNPGGGLSPSMPFAIALACFGMNMTFEEALVAATLNAAWALDRADQVGSLDPGKLADMVVVRGDAIDLVRVGTASVRAVIKRGAIVHGAVDEAH